ncbi:molybdopterin molybdotransferase MoeA [Marinomonas sp. 2405UD68-3]|uniref:molybdopterin molybdotransferase MoeA n=1 Tax=Marinomonas sp. 2405UD68-3 TaxID=3391835 RepID=UPI0039C9C853
MSHTPMMPFKDALIAIEEASACIVGQEPTELNNALNRILAVDIIAEINIPPSDNSAMDGYALSVQDLEEGKPLAISQRIPAGIAPHSLQPKTCARIFTGATIPEGADTVIMQENTEFDQQGRIVFNHTAQKGNNVRLKGQDVKIGQRILTKGTRLQPQHIGMLASLGVYEVTCFKQLKVGVLTTGNELVPVETRILKAGKIYNSNGPMLISLIQKLGHSAHSCLHVNDNIIETENALKSLSEDCDLILSSGGVSVGEEDHVKNAIEKNGSLSLWKVAIKPGKPLVFGDVFDTPFIGLPGNPSSSLVTFHWFARTAICAYSGEVIKHPKKFKVYPNFSRQKTISRDEFLRASLTEENKAVPHPQQSSGALFASCVCDGYLHIPANTSIDLNQRFDFYPFSSF